MTSTVSTFAHTHLHIGNFCLVGVDLRRPRATRLGGSFQRFIESLIPNGSGRISNLPSTDASQTIESLLRLSSPSRQRHSGDPFSRVGPEGCSDVCANVGSDAFAGVVETVVDDLGWQTTRIWLQSGKTQRTW